MAFPAGIHGASDRIEMIPFIPAGTSSILDVGCSHGLFGAALRRAHVGDRLIGIEPDIHSGLDAAPYYDEVIQGSYPRDIPQGSTFDCIVLNDVLEHLVDPWSVLDESRKYVAAGGRVVASIPNVRYLPVVLDLALRGQWEYTPSGVLDRTHLRFFTRATITKLFREASFVIERLAPINPIRRRGAIFIAGPFRDMRYLQFAVVARPADAPSARRPEHAV
jgi:SAM-dependent methyltransferase